MSESTSSTSHWPGLDGLRGIAALAVVVFHANIGEFGVNGYAGVDVFFALSGFLITSLLLAEHRRNGRISLRRFYARRLLRLYPALFATVLLVFVLAVAGGAVNVVLPAILAALLYVANWWVYTGGDAPMLEHTWTLAIEEHFYFVWPLIVAGLLSRRRALKILAATVALTALLVVLVPWSESIEGVRHSYLRGAPIIWGSALAVALRRWQVGPARAVGMAGSVAGIALVVLLLVPWRAPVIWMTELRSVPGLLSLTVVAALVSSPAWSNWLAWPPLVWAGRRSYGIYLYHFPAVSTLRHHVDYGPVEARMMLAFIVSLALAGVSYRVIELPFLRLKSRFRA